MRTALLFNIMIYSLLGLFINSVFSGSHTLDNEDVPATILNAFNSHYPDAAIEGYRSQEKDGQETISVVFQYYGKEFDASYNYQGTLLELEERIPSRELPSAINNVLAATFATFEIRQAEKVIRDKNIYYEIKIAGKHQRHNQKYELLFSKDSKLLQKYQI